MPRAHRHFLPGHVWHITHRCHQQEFLLKFARDRGTYLHWLFEAKKRYGLCVLDYAITSNHVHLLVKDTPAQPIAKSMQLIAGRTAQQYNLRKGRQGAFWEDRYHATAIEADVHLQRCLVYIDLNMVRAGVVAHPSEWRHGGYHEIHLGRERYAIVDRSELALLCGFADPASFREAHRRWVEHSLQSVTPRDDRWTSTIAVGSLGYVEKVKAALGIAATHRAIVQLNAGCALKEPGTAYWPIFGPEKGPSSPKSTP